MKDVSNAISKTKLLATWAVFLLLTAAFAAPARAIDLEFAGRPGIVMGYINQGVQFGIAGDHADTMPGFQAAIFQFLFEVAYDAHHDVKFFASTNLNIDWAYPILEGNDEWVAKEFDKSRDNLFILDDYETLLSELHVTWMPGDFVLRLGKQIVAWGETDGVRLMDQINPLDTRRGVSDVEFETTIIPIWLLKAEYFPDRIPAWMRDLGFEFVFNFNADFIADKSFSTGNRVSGIWAPNVSAGEWVDVPLLGFIPRDLISLLPPPLQPIFDRFPVYESRVGALTERIDQPKSWDPDYFEYGLRIKTILYDTFITLNGFYGRANSPVVRQAADLPQFQIAADGFLIVEPTVEGFFPLFKFVGFTLSRDFERLNIKALGGVGPVLRVEALYAFNSTFVTNGKVSLVDALAGQLEQFEKHDEIRYAIGIDWRVRIRWLNPRDSFTISPQFIHQHIMDYPTDYGLTEAGGLPVGENNYNTTLMVSTTYLHNKLIPMVFWQHSYQASTPGDMILAQLTYERDYHWNFTVQAVWLEGEGMEPLDHKDNVSVTAAYRF